MIIDYPLNTIVHLATFTHSIMEFYKIKYLVFITSKYANITVICAFAIKIEKRNYHDISLLYKYT